jgi:hypothetical protein
MKVDCHLAVPDLMKVPRPMWRDANSPHGDPINKAEIEAATHFNLAVAEMVRLNTPISPVEPHHYFRYDNLTGRYITITPAEYEDWGKDNRPEDAYAPAYAAPVAASDEAFCDGHCTWLDHQPGCSRYETAAWQFCMEGKWYIGMDTNDHRANTEAAGIPTRDLIVAPTTAVEPAHSDDVQVPREWLRFLLGESDLHGVAFGDARPPLGKFWWRTELRALLAGGEV